MATSEFKDCETKAFWAASSDLRAAVRECRSDIERLIQVVENHARYGIQPAIKARAAALVFELRPVAKTG